MTAVLVVFATFRLLSLALVFLTCTAISAQSASRLIAGLEAEVSGR